MKYILTTLIVLFLISSNDDFILYQTAQEFSDRMESTASMLIEEQATSYHEKEHLYSLLPFAKKRMFEILESELRIKNYFFFKVVYLREYPLAVSLLNYVFYIDLKEELVEEESLTI